MRSAAITVCPALWFFLQHHFSNASQMIVFSLLCWAAGLEKDGMFEFGFTLRSESGLLQFGQRADGTGVSTTPSTRWLVNSAASAA